MLCDNCRERDAVINLTQVEHDSKVTLHLCETCAQQKGVETGVGITKSPLANLIGSMTKGTSVVPSPSDGLRCASCGSTLKDFRESGRLGCGACYQSFDGHLRDLLRSEPVKTALIFCNRKRDVDILFKSLTRHGFQAGALHGDMAQDRRTATLERFRLGEIPILVASDVAARGLDIDDITHVFNFDVPYNAEDYVHRIGRTGRAGARGEAVSLVTEEDRPLLVAIEKLIGRRIEVRAVSSSGH